MRIAVRYDKFAYTVNIVLTDEFDKTSFFYTGIKVVPSDWDNKTKRIKTSNPDHVQLNRAIVTKYKEVEMMVTGNPLVRDISGLRMMKRMDKDKKLPVTLNRFWDQYSYESWKRTSRRFIDQRTFINNLNKFDPDIYWNKVNRMLVLDFDQWCLKKQYSDTTMKLYHQFLRTAILEAIRHGFIEEAASPFNNDLKFHYQNESNSTIYLEDYEIVLMADLHLTGTKKIIRDYFVISCYTALDYSTINTLSRNNFYQKGEHKFIRIQRVKSKVNVIIPVHPMVERIMTVYDYSLPKMPTDIRNYNYQIKNIARMAGISQFISVTIKREDRLMEKWELVSSHTGRRSAATNMYLAGLKPMQIRLITGHRTEESFLKYIRISKQYNADMVAESKYFQIQPKDG